MIRLDRVTSLRVPASLFDTGRFRYAARVDLEAVLEDLLQLHVHRSGSKYQLRPESLPEYDAGKAGTTNLQRFRVGRSNERYSKPNFDFHESE